MKKRRRGQKVDYKKLIYDKVFGNQGITKDKVVRGLRGARNAILEDIQEMTREGRLVYKNRGLWTNPDYDIIPNISKKRENLQIFLKNYRETVWKNIFPKLEENAKKSGKPIFYTESAADVIGKDARTGKPMSGEIQRINKKCKDELLLIMHQVNMLIRASFSLHIVQISSQKENTEEIKNEQKDVLDEISKTKRKLLEMTAKAGNLYGPAVFQMWWFQLTAGLQIPENNLVFLEE